MVLGNMMKMKIECFPRPFVAREFRQVDPKPGLSPSGWDSARGIVEVTDDAKPESRSYDTKANLGASDSTKTS